MAPTDRFGGHLRVRKPDACARCATFTLSSNQIEALMISDSHALVVLPIQRFPYQSNLVSSRAIPVDNANLEHEQIRTAGDDTLKIMACWGTDIRINSLRAFAASQV